MRNSGQPYAQLLRASTERIVYRAKAALTRGLGFCGLILRYAPPPHQIAFYDRQAIITHITHETNTLLQCMMGCNTLNAVHDGVCNNGNKFRETFICKKPFFGVLRIIFWQIRIINALQYFLLHNTCTLYV